jgi:hypothetical protein
MSGHLGATQHVDLPCNLYQCIPKPAEEINGCGSRVERDTIKDTLSKRFLKIAQVKEISLSKMPRVDSLKRNFEVSSIPLLQCGVKL